MEDHFAIIFPIEPIAVLDTTVHPVNLSSTVLKSAGSSLRYLFPTTEVVREKLVLKKYHVELSFAAIAEISVLFFQEMLLPPL